MTPTQTLGSAILMLSIHVVPALSQDAILPQGDPRLRGTQAEQEDIRDKRLKQQGQGPNYRVEGERQRPTGKADSAGDSNDVARQDTGISDPSVNPGQSAGMQTVQGRIITSNGDTHIVRQLSGMDTTLTVDGRTAGDTDLHPGDIVTGTITSQGRAVAIHKEARP